MVSVPNSPAVGRSIKKKEEDDEISFANFHS